MSSRGDFIKITAYPTLCFMVRIHFTCDCIHLGTYYLRQDTLASVDFWEFLRSAQAAPSIR